MSRPVTIGRKESLRKYNCSKKRKSCSKRYREKYKKKCYAWSKLWADKNKERVKELRKNRYATPEGKALRDATSKRYAKKNRAKRFAKDVINNAIKSGRIVKPMNCSECNRKEKIEGHHYDYAKPMEVIWLCKQCHSTIHMVKK